MHAQDFQGKATYQSKTSSDRNLEGRQLSEEQKRRIEQRLKSSLEKSYELVFDRTASLYTEEEKLDAPSAQSGRGGFRVNFADIGEGMFYKNIQQKVYVNQKELFGKNFLIAGIPICKSTYSSAMDEVKSLSYSVYGIQHHNFASNRGALGISLVKEKFIPETNFLVKAEVEAVT